VATAAEPAVDTATTTTAFLPKLVPKVHRTASDATRCISLSD